MTINEIKDELRKELKGVKRDYEVWRLLDKLENVAYMEGWARGHQAGSTVSGPSEEFLDLPHNVL